MEQAIVNILMAFFSAMESHPEWLKKGEKWGDYMLHNLFICARDILGEMYQPEGPSALWAIDSWANAHDSYYFQMVNLESELRKAHKMGILASVDRQELWQRMLEPLTIISLAQHWVKANGSLEGFALKKVLNVILENREWFIREDGSLISDQGTVHTHWGHTPVSTGKKTLVRTSDSIFEKEGRLWVKFHAAQMKAQD